MLERIFQRRDVCDFIEEILSDPKYIKKKNSNIRNNESFVESQQSLFIFLDALFKYAVIIQDEEYLDNYVVQIKKLISKVDDYVDINIGINRVIGSFCALKLGIDDFSSYLNKEKILKYIYDKYIVNGYLFHGYSGVYRSQISKYGMVPEQYQHIYPRFIEVQKLFKKHGLTAIDKDFSKSQLHFTDSFLMGCFYAANAPMYFSKLLVGFDHEELKNYNRSAYYKNNFFASFDNLNQLMKKYKFTDNEKKFVIKTCTDLWKSLGKDNSSINIILVKRSSLKMNYLNDITRIILSLREVDLEVAISKILNPRYDDISIVGRIDSSVIKFIEIPNYQALMDLRGEQLALMNKEKAMNKKLNNAYGMVSVLTILGSLFITIGVIITIIMVSRGM